MHINPGSNSAFLLERARIGDQASIEELLVRHDAEVRSTIDINPKWRSVLEADDVLQVTYLEAVLGLPHFKGEMAAFGPWLRTIARNNLRDAIKELERDKRPHPDQRVGVPAGQDSVVWLWNFLTGSSASPSSEAARGEIHATLKSKIDQLPVPYADAVTLVHFRGRSFDDAAKEMGRTYGAVCLLHRRALDRMRTLLGSESQFFSD